MDGRIIHKIPFANDVEDADYSPENSGGSPRSALSNDKKIASTSSIKRSKRGIQKRVVSVPIKDVEGLRLKGDQMSAPPSDSWAWRKYGQKPIKGSPYPRAYYRCSSSKGCPARKQVERSRVDPNMLVVTYACEHNHPWPASKNTHHHHHPSSTTTSVATANPTTSNATASVSEEEEEEEEEVEEKKPVVASTNQPQELVSEYKFPNLGEGPLVNEFGWFTDFEYTSCTMLESPILTDNDEMSMNFTMREEDEPLFADLGELPECSTVFRRGMVQREVEQQRHSLATTS